MPFARSQHSAVVFDEKIVIFGGKAKNFFFNDTIVLDPGTHYLNISSYSTLQIINDFLIATFLWQRVAEPTDKPIAKRAGHSTTVANNLMIVTGGVNSESDQICLTEISVLDLGKTTDW